MGLENQAEALDLYATDISRGGLFIRTPSPLPVGTKFEVRVKLRRRKLFRVDAEVLYTILERHAAPRGLLPGMGVRFAEHSPRDRRALEALVEHAHRCANEGEKMRGEPRDVAGSEQSVAAKGAIRRALKQAAYRAYGEAAATLDALLRDEPDNGNAQIWLHLVHARRLKQGRNLGESLKRYRAILALDKGHREARREVRRLAGGFWSRLFR